MEAGADRTTAPLPDHRRVDEGDAVLGRCRPQAGDSVRVDFSVDRGAWVTHRLAFFPPLLPVAVGPMAASPTEGGMAVTFSRFRVQPM